VILPRSLHSRGITRLARYVLRRVLAVLLTIFAGTFITVLLANQGGQVDKEVRNEVWAQLTQESALWQHNLNNGTPEERAYWQQLVDGREAAAGLHLPYWPRQLAWTIKALRLDWQAPVRVTPAPGSAYPSRLPMDILLTDLPHTLLLVGTSFLLLFLIGIPLSLYLLRVQGSRLDRFFTMLAPLSSVPSWVVAALLVLVFGAQLHLVPVTGMYDTVSTDSSWQRLLMVARHMIVPVIAILTSLLFQCVYTWRSFLLIHAEEDYVELAKAKGLPRGSIERRYILRPVLPYILTNFTLLLIGFWQMTIALEKVLNWPGIGRLYIVTLPNFFGESFYPGVMPITLSIVVVFAYLLGIAVLALDLSYALVDPQIRLGERDVTLREPPAARGRWRWPWQRRPRSPRFSPAQPAARLPRARISLSQRLHRLGRGLDALKPLAGELVRSPSAIFGLTVILIVVTGSLYAVTVYPYNKLAVLWSESQITGRITVPRLGSPAWVNYFRREKLPPSIILDKTSPGVQKTVSPAGSGMTRITINYVIPYQYHAFPQEIVLYFEPHAAARQPFAQLTWITPDGRELQIGRTAASVTDFYMVGEHLNWQRLLNQQPQWSSWFQPSGPYPTSRTDLLFADPSAEAADVLPGTYQLRIDALTFEPGADLDAQFVLIGQVYGLAGSDHLRRDLIVPLLWGMPFALIFGLLGAFVTTLLSMTLAAMAAWYGGGLDDLIQRLVEANMVLPVIAIGVLILAYFSVSIWTFLAIVVLLNVFASPTKSFRAAFLQVRNAPYIEAARAYGAGDARIILQYLVPRILPMFLPQLVSLIPSYVFLEATLGIFNIKSEYPTWGRTIYDALRYGSQFGSPYWVLEPLALVLLTGLAFAMLGFALERVLNPRTMGRGT